MSKSCSECGLKFEPEPGYFLGAMIFAYAIGALSTVPTIVISIFLYGVPIPATIAIACAQVILLNPFLFKYSRLVWLHVDHRADPR